MKRIAAFIFAAVLAAPAYAGPYGQALGACLADNTSGKDRKELARWIFAAMSAHPEMKELSSVTPETKEQVFRATGALVTRLLSESCADQAKAAIRAEGARSFEQAFGMLGRLAMQELMTNPEVRVAFSGFDRYIDKSKIDAALKAR
ncbi:MAG TPA: hypothetical protein VF211_16605 [Burkholderiales bacterium]